MHYSAANVIQYILTHPKREQCFPGWDTTQITLLVLNHVEDEGIAITTENGWIIGVILFEERAESSDLFIEGILTSSPKSMLSFVRTWERRYPGWRVLAHRKQRKISYSIAQFSRLLKRAETLDVTHRYADYNAH